jgi:ATP-dependent Lon protease
MDYDQDLNGVDESDISKLSPDEASEIGGQLVPSSEASPENLVVLPLTTRPIYPSMVVPIGVPLPRYVETVKHAVEQAQGYISLLLLKGDDPPVENPQLEDFYTIGVLGKVIKMGGGPDGQVKVLISSVRRLEVLAMRHTREHIWAKVGYPAELHEREDQEIRALSLALVHDIREMVQNNPIYTEEIKLVFERFSIDDPSRLADFAVTLTSASKEELQDILETMGLGERLEKALILLRKEREVMALQQKIRQQIEEKVSKQQREFFLREQLKVIKSELGLEKDPKSMELEKFRTKIEALKLTSEAQKAAEEELDKLSLIEPSSPEFNVSRTYLDWLSSLPWGIYSRERLNLNLAKKILDEDHYGLDDVKRRIVEFIAVRKVKKDTGGSIVCFVGPPGVGKTSMGKSIARTLNRKFYRFSLGGMRDEAEIKGHRRTYIGAMPGKLIQALKVTGTSNPVIMLDEIDKLGASFRGDPSSALLEVLDPEQNSAFRDHYLDLGFDFSKILFIVTANVLDTIPGPLLDRMEVLKLSGYIAAEKVHIARRYLIPKQMAAHGITAKNIGFTDAGLMKIIIGYAREAGVRNLEREIANICRKAATGLARGNKKPVSVTVKNVEKLLGQPRFEDNLLMKRMRPGVALGMAWTSRGGDTLYIEALAVPSKKGGFRQTGQLGEVMVESTAIAYTLCRKLLGKYGGYERFFDEHSIHLHVPAGATPKDGPSAGITMATALMSLALGRKVKSKLSMTGELTLTGRVLPVGGIKEKVIAARRAGVEEIIMPAQCERDFAELPKHIKEGIRFHLLSTIDQVLETALEG